MGNFPVAVRKWPATVLLILGVGVAGLAAPMAAADQYPAWNNCNWGLCQPYPQPPCGGGYGCGNYGPQNAQWRNCDTGPMMPNEVPLQTDAGLVFVRNDFPGRPLSVQYMQYGMLIQWV